MGYGVGQLGIYLSRGISLETGKPTVYSCVRVCFWSTRLLRRQKMKLRAFVRFRNWIFWISLERIVFLFAV